MEVIRNKRIVMFTWVTEQELGWLFTLNELEINKVELGNRDIAHGLSMLFENMNEDDIKTRNKALLGLYEEGFIKMTAEDVFGELEVQALSITQRGQKLLAEAEAIMRENESLLKEEEKTEKRNKRKKEVFEFLSNYGIPLAITVIKSVFTK